MTAPDWMTTLVAQWDTIKHIADTMIVFTAGVCLAVLWDRRSRKREFERVVREIEKEIALKQQPRSSVPKWLTKIPGSKVLMSMFLRLRIRRAQQRSVRRSQIEHERFNSDPSPIMSEEWILMEPVARAAALEECLVALYEIAKESFGLDYYIEFSYRPLLLDRPLPSTFRDFLLAAQAEAWVAYLECDELQAMRRFRSYADRIRQAA